MKLLARVTTGALMGAIIGLFVLFIDGTLRPPSQVARDAGGGFLMGPGFGGAGEGGGGTGDWQRFLAPSSDDESPLAEIAYEQYVRDKEVAYTMIESIPSDALRDQVVMKVIRRISDTTVSAGYGEGSEQNYPPALSEWIDQARDLSQRISDGKLKAQEYVAIAKAEAWLNTNTTQATPFDIMQTLDDGAQAALAAESEASRAKWQGRILASLGMDDEGEEDGPGLFVVLGFGIFGSLFTTVIKPVLFGVAQQKAEALLKREAAEPKPSKS